ncbi:MAG: transposase [Erysipelotrichaceae bacterium]
MLKAYKTEIKPTPEGKRQINLTCKYCRKVYNLFIEQTKTDYENDLPYKGGMAFSLWFNNEYTQKVNPNFFDGNKVSSKAIKQSIMNADKAYKNFFKKSSGYPRFHKVGVRDSFYVPRNGDKDILVERHRLKIPTIGWVHLKEKNYVPTKLKPRSCTVSMEGGRYYASVLFEVEEPIRPLVYGDGVGIDVGVKDTAILSDGTTLPTLVGNEKLRDLESKIIKTQKKLSRKKKGSNNFYKMKRVLAKRHQEKANKRNALLEEFSIRVVETLPAYVALEHLDIKEIMKNKYRAKQFREQALYLLKEKIVRRCHLLGIEVREANQYYASSKICSGCQNKKQSLSLKERTYVCDCCELVIDRDLNAAINLKQLTAYKLI